MAQFVATFHRVAMPQEFKHLFLIQGGSNAVENALKTAFDWKVRKNIAAGRGEKGSKIIHFKEAFHGRGGYTLSLTNTQDPKKTLYFPQFNWPRVENPKVKFPLTHGKNLEETIQAENRSLNQIKSILQSEGTDIAALIIEPIQGEGGDNHFRPEFFQQLRKICSENEILFICDEVQAGLGLTGKFWAYQHYNIVPDIVVFGKKAQVCGIIATARVDEVKDNVFQLSSRINSTWGGNLVDMVRSRKFLEIIEEENLVQNASQVGSYLLQQIEKLGNQFPSLISNVRGKGLLVSFDVPNANYCSKVKELSYHRGMLIISCGVSTIRFRPFLDTTIKEVDVLVRNLREVFAEIFALPQSKL
jgi:L-lysine 6-transaminase